MAAVVIRSQTGDYSIMSWLTFLELQVEITLVSKDEKEFKVDYRVAIMSETIKSMMGVENEDDEVRSASWKTPAWFEPGYLNQASSLLLSSRFEPPLLLLLSSRWDTHWLKLHRQVDPPEAAIPLPAVDGLIVELVLKYCDYHYRNKETKEEDKSAWDAEFVKVDDDTLFSLILVSYPLSLPSFFLQKSMIDCFPDYKW